MRVMRAMRMAMVMVVMCVFFIAMVVMCVFFIAMVMVVMCVFFIAMVMIVMGMLFIAMVMVVMCVFFIAMVMVVMCVLFIAMVMIVMGVLFIAMVMVVMIVMAMRLEQCAFPEIEKQRALRIQKGGHRGVCCERVDGVFKPWRQIGANPEHKVSLLQSAGLRGAQTVLMGRSALLNDQVRCSDAIHDSGDQRVDRRDIYGDIWRLRHGCAAHQGRGDREREQLSGHG